MNSHVVMGTCALTYMYSRMMTELKARLKFKRDAIFARGDYVGVIHII